MLDSVKSGILRAIDIFIEWVILFARLLDFSAKTVVLLVQNTSARFLESNPYATGIGHTLLFIVIIAQFFIVRNIATSIIRDFHAPIILPPLLGKPIPTRSGFTRMWWAILIYFLLTIYCFIWIQVLKYMVVGVSLTPLT